MDTRTIVIHLFDGFEELDAIGPWEVLSFWTRTHPQDGYHVLTTSEDGRSVRAAKGLLVTPDAALGDVPHIDVFLEPGGRGSRSILRDPVHLGELRRVAGSGALMTSVCTGSLVYAAAGLLDGRAVTTHHNALDDLRALVPSAEVREERWVDDGDLVTAAGVSAGIDMALYLVGRLASPERARSVQNDIAYHPAPPRFEVAGEDG